MLNQKRFALSFAEVMVALAVIGVCAALTMPGIVKHYRRLEALTQVQRELSVMSQAFTRAIVDHGDSNEWDEITPETAEKYFDYYWKPYLQAPNRCYNYKECGYESVTPFYKTNRQQDAYMISPNAGSPNSRILFNMNDGSFVMVITGSGYGANDRRILVDMNGPKLPNRFGNDVFFFLRVPGKGVAPYGYDSSIENVKADCSLKGSGYKCAARLMYNGWVMEKDYPF